MSSIYTRLHLFGAKPLYRGNATFDPDVCLSPNAVTALELQQPCTPICCTYPDCHQRHLPDVLPAASTAPSDLGSRFVLTMLADAAACQSR